MYSKKRVMTLTSVIMCQLHTDADLVWLSYCTRCYCIVVQYVIVPLRLVLLVLRGLSDFQASLYKYAE